MYDPAVGSPLAAPRRPTSTLPGLSLGPDDGPLPVDREPAFRRQLVKADRLLNGLLAVMMAFGVVVFAAAVAVSQRSSSPIERPIWISTMAVMLASIAVFASMYWRLDRTLASGELPPPVTRIVVSLLVVPTPITAALLAMALGNASRDPAIGVILPFGSIYTGVICLSLLRFDWKPVVATGVSAMLQYGAVSLLVHHNVDAAIAAGRTLTPNGQPITHYFAPMEVGKVGVLGIATVLSAFAAGYVRERVAELMVLSRKEERLRGLFGQHVGR